MIKKEHPFIAMVNQRFHRTYIDCAEFVHHIDADECCKDCLSGSHSMLDAPSQNKIYMRPPAKDGANTDWTMNIEAVVCCRHVHYVPKTREEWFKLVEKFQATPFYTEQTDTRYSFDESDSTRLISSRNNGIRRPIQRNDARNPVENRGSESGGRAFNKTVKCQFCSRPHPIFGLCPRCYPNQEAGK